MGTIARVKYSHWADSPEAAGVNNITAVFTEKERKQWKRTKASPEQC